MRVLVCGGRDFGMIDRGCPPDPGHEHRRRAHAESFLLTETLDTLHVDRGITCIIHGAASGADTLARRWAEGKLIEAQAFPADWRGFGRAAGPLRNARMLAEGRPDLVLAFPGGAGTADCVRKARAAGIEVVEVGA